MKKKKNASVKVKKPNSSQQQTISSLSDSSSEDEDNKTDEKCKQSEELIKNTEKNNGKESPGERDIAIQNIVIEPQNKHNMNEKKENSDNDNS